MAALDPELLDEMLAELSARRLPKNDLPKYVALIFAAAVAWGAFEARMRVVEDRYDQLKAAIIEMKDDLRAIRERRP
jgi:hypothetical protein